MKYFLFYCFFKPSFVFCFPIFGCLKKSNANYAFLISGDITPENFFWRFSLSARHHPCFFKILPEEREYLEWYPLILHQRKKKWKRIKNKKSKNLESRNFWYQLRCSKFHTLHIYNRFFKKWWEIFDICCFLHFFFFPFNFSKLLKRLIK